MTKGNTFFKYCYFLPFLFYLSFTTNLSSSSIWEEAREGNKVFLIRHALAPGGGDPAGFKINDCNTQRNLNKVGINQSKK